MTQEERDQLLARYATGQLSETELRRLREAAFDDQSLFDAMAGEEELRDLLAEPEARREVVEALTPPGSLSLSSWRRPWAWASAGGLAAVAILTVSVWRLQEKSAEVAMQRDVERPSPVAAAPPPVVTPPATEAPTKPAPMVRAKRAEPLPEQAQEQMAKLALPEAVELKKQAADEAARKAEAPEAVSAPVPAAPAVIPAQKIKASVPSPAWSVRWYVEGLDGTRTPIESGAEIDRGATVIAEVHSTEGGAFQLTPSLDTRKEERDGGNTVAPGQTRIFRWRLDQPGTQQLTVTPRPTLSAGRAISAQTAMRDAAVAAPSGFNESAPRPAQISLRVR